MHCSPTLPVTGDMLPVPPFGSNVIEVVLPSHWAYKVTVSPAVAVRFFTDWPFVYDVPLPSAFVFHPASV